MADAAKTLSKRMTVEEFLEWQLHQDKLYELVDGRPYLPLKMMTGATSNHDTVTVNALASFHAQLRGKPCRPRTDDIALRIPAGGIRRPDMLVDCGASGPKDTTAAEPRLVLEVLSPSTAHIDRFQKVEEYKTVQSLRAILLVETETPGVMLYAREREESPWTVTTEHDLDAVLGFPAIGATLRLRDLYDGVIVSQPAPE